MTWQFVISFGCRRARSQAPARLSYRCKVSSRSAIRQWRTGFCLIRGAYPGLCWVKVYALHPFRPCK
jgi:hypothetical protein